MGRTATIFLAVVALMVVHSASVALAASPSSVPTATSRARGPTRPRRSGASGEKTR